MNLVNLVNLTPHIINIALNGNLLAIAPDGREARVSAKNVPAGEVLLDDVNAIPVVQSVYGDVETVRKNAEGKPEVLHVGVPEPEDGVVYIVSMLVGSRVSGRNDIVGPDSGPTAIRENGQVKAVRNLIKYS